MSFLQLKISASWNMLDCPSLFLQNSSLADLVFACCKFCSIPGLFCSGPASGLAHLSWLHIMIWFLSLYVLVYFVCLQLACSSSNWEHCSGLCYQRLVSYALGDSGLGLDRVASYLGSSQAYYCQRTFWYYSSKLWKFQASLSGSWSGLRGCLAEIDHLYLLDWNILSSESMTYYL